MPSRPMCNDCGARWGAVARDGLCIRCHLARQPETVNGAEIRQKREMLGISIMDAAAAVGVEPKFWVDSIELDDVDATYATAVICALEALHQERVERQEREHERSPAPLLSAELIAERS